jgi:putative addiction module component (TIGR02574 family)
MKAKSKATPAGQAIETGSGNVFKDLGLADPDERQLRVQLAARLNDLLQAEGLTQAAAAKLLGMAQPHVSELKNYKLSRFSSERLLHCITLLNRDMDMNWESIAALPEAIEVSPELKAELSARLAEFERDPEAGYSWDQVKTQLKNGSWRRTKGS